MNAPGKWVTLFDGRVEQDIVECEFDPEQAQRYRATMNRSLARQLAELGDARDALVRDIRNGLHALPYADHDGLRPRVED